MGGELGVGLGSGTPSEGRATQHTRIPPCAAGGFQTLHARGTTPRTPGCSPSPRCSHEVRGNGAVGMKQILTALLPATPRRMPASRAAVATAQNTAAKQPRANGHVVSREGSGAEQRLRCL